MANTTIIRSPADLATHSAILDDALSSADPTWGFCFALRDVDRDAMDAMLVDREHPLAFVAGTQESRFLALRREGYRFTRREG